MKSRWNRSRYAMASRAASTHASGSSALTWTIGILNPRANPLAYDVLYSSSGLVVNPSWLLTMMWIVPPV